MRLRILARLAAFVVPTTAIGYGIVIPRSCKLRRVLARAA